MKDIEKEKKKILDVIKRHRIMRVQHIFAYYGGMCRSLFYERGLDKMDDIKEALEKNRCHAKSFMLDKWVASDNPTLQIAAYRMIGDEEERERLIQSKVDLTSAGKQMPAVRVEVIDRREDVMKENGDEDNPNHKDI